MIFKTKDRPIRNYGAIEKHVDKERVRESKK